jgi:phosphinothricin acetyltransferase
VIVEYVRPAVEGDLVAISEIYDHYVRTSHATFDVEPVGIDHRREWLQGHAGGRHRVFVAVGDGRVIGFARSGRYRPRPAYDTTVETSVYVDPAFVGRGVGSALYRVVFDALAHEDVHRALAGIGMPNDASVALHERFGFRRAAHFSEQGRKFGRYWDVDWYERPVGETEEITLPACRGSAGREGGPGHC